MRYLTTFTKPNLLLGFKKKFQLILNPSKRLGFRLGFINFVKYRIGKILVKYGKTMKISVLA